MAVSKGFAEDSVRLSARASAEVNKKIDETAEELSISKTAILSLIVHLGLTQLLRTMHPEDFVNYANLSKGMQEAGYDVQEMLDKDAEKK